MKIISVRKFSGFSVETDEDYWPNYRRGEHGGWEQLMGDSWESTYSEEEKLEKAFMEYIISNAVHHAAEIAPITDLSWFPKNNS